ncbi:hypothetical protein [Sinimarinibacterium thermocellulolyticum]|uniref:Phosphodiesterase n=1 Tax=Sinimarinibacterium thermocellulolyticum TaxID=3170016 RepID=A0ABV2A620_9GAMM
MHTVTRLLVVVASVFACSAYADVLSLPGDPAAAISAPSRGMHQSAVVRQFGEPLRRHPPVGGGKPRQPPITRWDYDGWSVFFENDIAIDVVVKDAPAPIHNVEALQQAP